MFIGWDNKLDRLPLSGFLFDVVARERVPRRQDRASAITKQNVDAFVCKHLDDHVRAGHYLTGERMLTGRSLLLRLRPILRLRAIALALRVGLALRAKQLQGGFFVVY